MQWVQNSCVKRFRLRFSTGRFSRKNAVFRLEDGSSSRKTRPEKLESKKPFFDCIRKPDLGFSRKRPFSTDKSDGVRNEWPKAPHFLFGGVFFCFCHLSKHATVKLHFLPWEGGHLKNSVPS